MGGTDKTVPPSCFSSVIINSHMNGSATAYGKGSLYRRVNVRKYIKRFDEIKWPKDLDKGSDKIKKKNCCGK